MSNRLRFPIRVDLKKYAVWIANGSTRSRNGRGGTTRHRVTASLKQFLAFYLGDITGQQISIDTLDDLLETMPLFIATAPSSETFGDRHLAA